MSSRNEFPTPEEIQADRIKTLWEYCPSAVPYITYAQKQGGNARLQNAERPR